MFESLYGDQIKAWISSDPSARAIDGIGIRVGFRFRILGVRVPCRPPL